MNTQEQNYVPNQQANMFYDSTKARIVNSDINKILDSIIDQKFEKLTKQNFEILGSVAYMFGMDFMTQKKSFNKMTISNWCLRMKDMGLNAETISRFQYVLSNINVETIEKTKDSLKNLMLKEAKFEFNNLKQLKLNIDSIIKTSTFPVGFATEINDLLKSTKYTYGDLLKINKFIYENLTISGKIFPKLNAIHGNIEFSKNINKASEYYDLQKFSLIYFDSLLTLKEWFEIETFATKDTYIQYLEDNSLIENIIEPTETEKVIENIEVNNPENISKTISEATPEETDLFLHNILMEKYNTDDFGNSDSVISSILMCSEDEDLVQHVYQFVKTRKELNRIDFKNVYNFDKSELLTKLDLQYKSIAEEYKKLVETYVKEFTPEEKSKIVNYINDIITSLVIDNSEKKAYLFQQLNENQVHTYKHLQQMLGLIEDCNIAGNSINSYISLRDYLNLNEEIASVFESIQQIDNLQVKLSLLLAFQEFYLYEPLKQEPSLEVVK